MSLTQWAETGKVMGAVFATTILFAPIGLAVFGGMRYFGHSSSAAALVIGIVASVAAAVVSILWRA
ncbi:hypothetical protein FDP22_15140 [Paroceanicella profunda]|uniref:Uncharacterized protein n=1 Tax=Paroceanicella profunda TaxID=2579971 RepID=A0A5B8G2X0_9RHOB|nr:hypothetical protein [Paroceanicella profunda]QDL93003.1 hypothetical protein FDP22_15140 [Paroceanicella profunda]